MSLKIRLARHGSKKDPHYPVVVAESHRKRDGKFIERVGHYHPRLSSSSPDRLVINLESVRKWIKVGARPTEVVVRLLKTLDPELFACYKVGRSPDSLHGLSKKVLIEMKKKAASDAADARKAAAKKLLAEQEAAKNVSASVSA